MPRLIAVIAAIALAIGVALTQTELEDNGTSGDLSELAASLGFADRQGFVEVVETVQQTGRLPDDYVTKGVAESLGWRPGSDLCDVAPERVIGGDRFHNREGRLPDTEGRVWFEADLDFACGRRGAKRLVFSNDGLIYVTVDHYESFTEVGP